MTAVAGSCPRGELAIRTLAMPADTNPAGDIFGGWIMSQMDVAGGIAAFTGLLLAMMSVGNLLLGSEPEWINRSLATQAAWLLWNIVSMAAGGYATAWIAPRAAVTHALAMAALQTMFTLVAFLTISNTATPLWLWVGGMVLNFPAAVSGARLSLGSKSVLAAVDCHTYLGSS